MNKRILILPAALLMIASAVFAAAQTTTTTVTKTPTTVTKTVQNPDGSYTIVEYPVGKEVQLALTPVSLAGSKAVGTILRDDAGTRVVLNMTDVPADVTAINVYAVDDAGVVTSLGPVVLANGAGKFTTTTPLSKFMLIAAPEGLTTYDPNAKVYFRSAVPEGFAVIPFTTSPVGETVAATTVPVTSVPATTVAATTVPTTTVPATTVAVTTVPTTTVPAATVAVTTVPATTVPTTTVPVTTVATTTEPTSTVAVTTVPATTVAVTTVPATTTASVSTVPMLNIPAYTKGDDTKLKVDFTGAMAGARANIFIEPHKDKPTDVKVRFHELKEAPTGQTYILWAVSPDNQFHKLGQIVNDKSRNEAEIKATTTLPDFGLLVTMEDLTTVKTILTPVGPRLGVIHLIP